MRQLRPRRCSRSQSLWIQRQACVTLGLCLGDKLSPFGQFPGLLLPSASLATAPPSLCSAVPGCPQQVAFPWRQWGAEAATHRLLFAFLSTALPGLGGGGRELRCAGVEDLRVCSSLSELLVVPGGLGWATCRVSDHLSWSAQDRGVSQEAGLAVLKPGTSW